MVEPLRAMGRFTLKTEVIDESTSSSRSRPARRTSRTGTLTTNGPMPAAMMPPTYRRAGSGRLLINAPRICRTTPSLLPCRAAVTTHQAAVPYYVLPDCRSRWRRRVRLEPLSVRAAANARAAAAVSTDRRCPDVTSRSIAIVAGRGGIDSANVPRELDRGAGVEESCALRRGVEFVACIARSTRRIAFTRARRQRRVRLQHQRNRAASRPAPPCSCRSGSDTAAWLSSPFPTVAGCGLVAKSALPGPRATRC